MLVLVLKHALMLKLEIVLVLVLLIHLGVCDYYPSPRIGVEARVKQS